MALNIVCFGEVLWDVFTDKKIIGGAPFNVALRLGALGNKIRLISKVGEDEDGKSILSYLNDSQVITDSIQADKILPTGRVLVHLDQTNTATYTIEEPVAWDNIELTSKDVDLVKKADALVYGSLSCRNKITRESLMNLFPEAKFRVFDANLRPPFYDLDLILNMMKSADLIKLNDEELIEILHFLRLESESFENSLKILSEITQTHHICITKGGQGATFFSRNKFYRNTGYKVTVKDTVGAGDSFLANFIHQFLRETDPQMTLDHSCAMGAIVASKEGASAQVKMDEIERLMRGA